MVISRSFSPGVGANGCQPRTFSPGSGFQTRGSARHRNWGFSPGVCGFPTSNGTWTLQANWALYQGSTLVGPYTVDRALLDILFTVYIQEVQHAGIKMGE
jgi:hypothetical protein